MAVFRIILICAGFLACAASASAQSAKSVTAYVWGNSLFHHLSNSDDTTVPHWLSRLARADGRELRLDGQWGFARDFATTLPPQPNWSFKEVRSAWDSERRPFSEAGFDTLILNPANFIQYQSPDAPYEGDNPTNTSPQQATIDVFAWARAQGGNPVYYIYEGWAELGQYPPTRRKFRQYMSYSLGEYHDWFRRYHDGVSAALPNADVRFIPVASTIAKLVTEGPLEDLRPTDLYVDDAPHGTETTYFLAAMITYSALYNAPPPMGFGDFDKVNPTVIANYDATAAFIWEAMQADLAPRDTALLEDAPAPALPEAEAPKEVKVAEPVTITAPPAPLPAESASDAIGLGNPSLAMGLNGIADWSTQHPFIDLMKTARPWVGHLPNEWGAVSEDDLRAGGHLDAQGWVTSFPAGVTNIESFILTDQPKEATSLDARYRVRWEGKGDLHIGGVGRTRERKENELWFNYRPSGEGLVAIALSEVDPDDPVRNIEVVREDHTDLHDAGVVFNPDFIAKIQDLRSLRFMDWTFTNSSYKRTWDDRAKVDDRTFVGPGVPVEYIIRLSNLIGADPWVNMPHLADDDFMRRYAEMMHEGLDPRLQVYVEYSNEVWNFIFEQAVHARDSAAARWGSAARDDAWMQWAGLRAAEMADIWIDVFVDSPERLVPTVGVHSGWVGLEEPLLEAPLWVAEGNEKPASRFKAYAVTGYFGYELGGDDYAPQILEWVEAAEAEVRAEGEAKGLQRVALREYVRKGGLSAAYPATANLLREASIPELVNDIWPYHARTAASYGMHLVMYEGGTHVAPHGAWSSSEKLSKFMQEFNYSQEMGDIYGELLTAWKDVGGTLFNAFVDIAPPSQYGSWGALRHIDDETLRWDALMGFNSEQTGWWEARREDAFVHGVLRWGTAGADTLEGTTEEDILMGGPGDDTFLPKGRADVIHGGSGNDVVILSGVLEDYTARSDGQRKIVSNGIDAVTIYAVERLQFDDAEVLADDL